MLLFIHIIIALLSIVVSTYLLIHPSKTKIKVSYASIALTFFSGIALVIATPSALVHMCIIGLFYSCGTLFIVALASRKLQKATL